MTVAAPRDDNRIPTLLGVSSSDGTTPVTVYANPVTHRLLVSTSAIPTVYSEVLTDSGDHKNFTSVHTINAVLSLMDGTGKGIPLKDASGTTNYTFTGTTLTLVAADANIAAAGVNLIYL